MTKLIIQDKNTLRPDLIKKFLSTYNSKKKIDNLFIKQKNK